MTLPALSVPTDARVDPALINVSAGVARLVQCEAWLTLALEGVDCVAALPVLTDPGEHGTLVDQLAFAAETEELLRSVART